MIQSHNPVVVQPGFNPWSDLYTSNKSAIFADFYEINQHQDRRYLSYDGKCFRWAGNLESLKHFVENGVKLLGIWTSPGGSSKMFTCSYLDLTLTWYPGKC